MNEKMSHRWGKSFYNLTIWEVERVCARVCMHTCMRVCMCVLIEIKHARQVFYH